VHCGRAEFSAASGSLVISSRTIIRVVAEHYGFTREQLLAKSRKPDRAQPRQLAMLLCRIMTGDSYPTLGRAFGRDHSSVMHGCAVIEEELKECLVLQAAVRAIKARLSAMEHAPMCPHCGEELPASVAHAMERAA
jgi:chromosomal replication initiation ATPase DnaA